MDKRCGVSNSLTLFHTLVARGFEAVFLPLGNAFAKSISFVIVVASE